MTLIYFASPKDWPAYETALPSALMAAGVAAQIVTSPPDDAGQVDYIIYAPSSPLQDFTPYRGCKAVLSLWAGVERIVANPTLTQPLCRMVEPSLTQGMVEYVTGHVLRHHLGMDAHIHNPGHVWHPQPPPLAQDRQIAMLGMGVLGTACARSLAALGFAVMGWSRSGKAVGGIAVFSGQSGLRHVLSQADIIVTLLPNTPDTEYIIGHETLSWAKRGAVLINPGRGSLVDDDALIAALDLGQLGHATLDVFRIEPLPQDHRFWSHPRITITPHIAASTRAGGAARSLAENIRLGQLGEPFQHMVDRNRAY